MSFELPKDKHLGIVFGKPIEVTKNKNPSDKEVRNVHAKYIAQLERLFNEYKDRFGCDADEKLVVT